MENFSDFEQQQQGVEEDALSLCDLLLDDDGDESVETPKASPSSDPADFFEFCVDPICGYLPMDVVFCGKSILCSKPITLPTPEPQIKNPFFSRSESLRFSQASASPARSDPVPATGKCRSPSSNSRKHKVLIGLVKYQPEMDLSEIRKRQSRRAPAPMFPVINGGEQSAVVGGKRGSGKGHWGPRMMRQLRCPSHLLSALAKATLGCVPRVTV
ncbi:PREDICTED: uncharacterized protein LOC103332396 [Prunus mume]|uniref:Uncharacterized protein LOC103332396 n=1 Tax=Prunus mume TaxID=102107 RepID=A0ABM0P288_PRUMU|nr:PREDICTED: uncharacterized protein LOC103332396 [Prunus mume]